MQQTAANSKTQPGETVDLREREDSTDWQERDSERHVVWSEGTWLLSSEDMVLELVKFDRYAR